MSVPQSRGHHCWSIESPYGATVVVRAGRARHEFQRHFHESYGLCVNVEGGGTFHHRGVRHEPRPGTLVLTNPGDWNAGTSREPWSYVSVHLAPTLLGALAREHGLDGPPRFERPVVQDPELARAFTGLLAGPPPDERALEAETRWLELLVRLVAAHGARTASRGEADSIDAADLERVREYLRASFHRVVHLEELTRLVGSSPSYLVTRFRRRYGLPPHAYQTALRVERARDLIAAGHPLAQVATAVGFYDQSHLTRTFRRIMNVTPGRYAAACAPRGRRRPR